MTTGHSSKSDDLAKPFSRSSNHSHESTQSIAPRSRSAAATTTLRTLLVMSDAKLCLQAESLLKRSGFRPICASDSATAIRWLDRDPDIGIVVIQGHADEFSIGDFITDARNHAGRPLAAVLLVSDTLISVMRDIARSNGIEIVVHPAADDDLLTAARAAARWCDSSRQADELRHSTLALLSAMQDQAGKLLGRIDDGAFRNTRAHSKHDATPPPAVVAADIHPVETATARSHVSSPVVGSGMIKTLLRLQSLQQATFGQGVIDVAAWVMLLDLLLSHVNGKRLGVTALCIGAGVPLTTALRRIDELVASGLAEKQADPIDRRRSFVAITEKGDECIRGYVERLKEELQMAEKNQDFKLGT